MRLHYACLLKQSYDLRSVWEGYQPRSSQSSVEKSRKINPLGEAIGNHFCHRSKWQSTLTSQNNYSSEILMLDTRTQKHSGIGKSDCLIVFRIQHHQPGSNLRPSMRDQTGKSPWKYFSSLVATHIHSMCRQLLCLYHWVSAPHMPYIGTTVVHIPMSQSFCLTSLPLWPLRVITVYIPRHPARDAIHLRRHTCPSHYALGDSIHKSPWFPVHVN